MFVGKWNKMVIMFTIITQEIAFLAMFIGIYTMTMDLLNRGIKTFIICLIVSCVLYLTGVEIEVIEAEDSEE